MKKNINNGNNEVNQKIMDRLKELGIQIVDVSHYPTHHCGFEGTDSIIVGYVPGKAAVFTVENNYGGDIKFTVHGQIRKTSEAEKLLSTEFSEIKRSPVGGESFGGFIFSINTYTGYYELTDDEDIKMGITFFKNILDRIGIFLENRFTEFVNLCFVPIYSDQYEEIEARNGSLIDETCKFFNKKVMDKFPVNFFVKEQRY